MKYRFSVVSICFLIAVSLAPTAVLAKTPILKETPVAVSPTPVISGEVLGITTVKKVDYLLPYPGILLDNPLYFLKQIRDFILERLIVDPIRKSEFYILQADKFVNMAVFLADKGKTALVGKAVTLADKNINLAVNGLLALKGNGVGIPASITDHLTNALAKYVEVLTQLQTKVEVSQKDVITSVIADLKQLQGELSKLK